MHTDIQHWTTLKYPAAPSDENVKMFKSLIVGKKVLLLGSTRQLLPLVTHAYDLCPKYDDPKIENRNWISISEHFDTIIGDGIFGFDKELNDNLLKLCSMQCRKMVVRSFNKAPNIVKYAKIYPMASEFIIKPVTYYESDFYNFYVWDFK